MNKRTKIGIGTFALVSIITIGVSANIGHAFDFNQFNKEKKAQVDQDLYNDMHQKPGSWTPTDGKYKDHTLPKPSFNIHRIKPLENGTYQIGALDHGPVKVNDLWLKDLKTDNNEVWNEDDIGAGVQRNDPSKGIIFETVINTKDYHYWNIPGDVGGSVTIVDIKGDNVTYKTANGTGVLNTATGVFSNN